MIRRRVLDFSNYTGLNPDIPALVNAGWDGVILGTQNPSVTRRQFARCQANSFKVDALYVFVYWDNEDWRRLDEAIALSEELSRPVWLDCEWHTVGYPGTGWPPSWAQLVDLIRQYKERLGVHYAGIYTGGWWWPSYTGNSTEFAGDPLWHAAYQTTEPDFDDFRAYGGWTRPRIWQYSSKGTQGVNADLNIEEVPELVPNPPVVVGVGAHYDDGSQEEIWTTRPGKTLDGIGTRYSDGSIEHLWP